MTVFGRHQLGVDMFLKSTSTVTNIDFNSDFMFFPVVHIVSQRARDDAVYMLYAICKT